MIHLFHTVMLWVLYKFQTRLTWSGFKSKYKKIVFQFFILTIDENSFRDWLVDVKECRNKEENVKLWFEIEGSLLDY